MSDVHFLRLPDVQKRVGLKKTKIYALMKEDKFPRARKQGRTSYWPDVEISAWQAEQLAAQ